MPYLVEPVIADGVLSSGPQPELHAPDGLRLRPFVDDDAPGVRRAFDDPDIQRWHGFRIDDADEAVRWIRRTHESWADQTSAGWAVVDESDVLLGRCALHLAARRGTGEIAYWVLPDARRTGVAVRAARVVTEWGHRHGIHRILLQHSTHNVASCAVARGAGYVVEGVARRAELHVDGLHDMHQHAHVVSD